MITNPEFLHVADYFRGGKEFFCEYSYIFSIGMFVKYRSKG